MCWAQGGVEITSDFIPSLSSACGRNTCSNCIYEERVLFCRHLQRFWGQSFQVLTCQSMLFPHTCSGCRSVDTKEKDNKIRALPCTRRPPLDARGFYFISSVNSAWVICKLDCYESTCFTKCYSSFSANSTSCQKCYRDRVGLTDLPLLIARCHKW